VDAPEVRYARSGDAHIAYQVMGAGPVDLVVVMGFISHLEHWWEDPGWAALWQRLSSFCRLILFRAGHQGARQFFKVYVTAFPDLHFDIEQILAAGDSHVAVRWRSSGTHLGPLADIPATGRKASNHGCTVMEVKSGKGAHAWVYFDNAHLLRQIGVLPGS
jgi:steroid delta-isomerase-like uncharacterized protein